MPGANSPYTGLDHEQVIRQCFDEVNDRLRTDATLNIDSATISVDINHVDDSVRLGDGTSLITSTTIGPKVGLDVNIINPISVEIDAADGDNIAISDGTNTLSINANGSLNIEFDGDITSSYNEVLSVASSVSTTINTYTAPGGKISYLQKVDVSGTNIAEYTIEINSVIEDKKRTYFGNSLNDVFNFSLFNQGLPLSVGDVVTVKVIHVRPSLGDFNARIQALEI